MSDFQYFMRLPHSVFVSCEMCLSEFYSLFQKIKKIKSVKYNEHLRAKNRKGMNHEECYLSRLIETETNLYITLPKCFFFADIKFMTRKYLSGMTNFE